MPDWTSVTLTMEGLNRNGRYATAQSDFDFNKIVKMPKSVLHTESGGTNGRDVLAVITDGFTVDPRLLPDVRKAVVAELVHNLFSPKLERAVRIFESEKKLWGGRSAAERRAIVRSGERLIGNWLKYGHMNWYDWANARWGTKWNACDVFVESADVVRFETAWCAPWPVIVALSGKNPKKTVTVEWLDEDEYDLPAPHRVTFLGGIVNGGDFAALPTEVLLATEKVAPGTVPKEAISGKFTRE